MATVTTLGGHCADCDRPATAIISVAHGWRVVCAAHHPGQQVLPLRELLEVSPLPAALADLERLPHTCTVCNGICEGG